MNKNKEFIWISNHFVCHITREDNIPGIMDKGLLPLNGERCKSAMDERKGVFCLDGIHNVPNWTRILYGQYNLETLKLLRFNLKLRKWYIDNTSNPVIGMYLPHKVSPRELDYLQIINGKNDILPITQLLNLDFLNQIDESFNNLEDNKEIIVDDCMLCWKPIYQYKKELKR